MTVNGRKQRAEDEPWADLPVGLLSRSGIPLYRQLMDILGGAIVDGVLPIGSALQIGRAHV